MYLTYDDIFDYLKSGRRNNKNRLQAYYEGKRIILTSKDELREFLYGNNDAYADTVSFGKVSERLADEIRMISDGVIDDLYGGYLEVEKGHAGHAIANHTEPKELDDLPLCEYELLLAFENTNDAKVLEVTKYITGERTVTLGISSEDGHVIMIETASKSRGSLLFRNGWKINNDKFARNYLRSNPNSAVSESLNSVRDGIAPYMDNVTKDVMDVNSEKCTRQESNLH
ncbi:hypothetical protein bhn_I1921 [Butyrivibrio hungatei]|uniref:Phage-Barnase-EndoU-ColicinE5/D-RelE like nuclease 3 domain-containing protein n=2 Tax=Butyrivibrio hungatei TaxID=185008 RepID=A0A1D9P3N9_9FIRM|nr:hypothetical protein bhn_I1921 [Butyrivibrio hungatei]